MTTASAFPIPPSTRFRRHEHESGHICVVIAGGFVERNGKSWRDVAPGTVRVSGAARHDIDFSAKGAVCLVMEVTSDEIGQLGAARFFENDKRLSTLADRITQSSVATDIAGEIRTDSLTTEFLAQISRRLNGKPDVAPPWLDRVRSILHDTCGQTTLAQLATEAGVHRVHLARTFRDHYGIPVASYARNIRVQSAVRLLSNGEMTLSQLAATAGFSDQSHLTRTLRSRTGSTPAALRSMLQTFKT
jgi:AraC family transcriptional regulator